MIELNLAAEKPELKVLKTYLENNVSEVLADKINNGVRTEKDGKTLISKKTLETFWKYAHDEAQKQSEKGARGAHVEDETVFGWMMHYFEEDSLEGVLYNEDGTEYKPPRPVYTPSKTAPAVVKPKPQMSLFDSAGGQTEAAEQQDETAADGGESDEDADDDTNGQDNDTETEGDMTDDTDGQDDGEDETPDEIETDNTGDTQGENTACNTETESTDKTPDDGQTPRLIRISETQCVDGDGVVHSDSKNRPDNAELNALRRIFGNALKVG